MRVLKVEPYMEPYEIDIPSNLESLQKEVDGNIQVIYPYADLVGIVCNEEGKVNELELNRSLYDDAGERFDIIAGSFLVVGLSEDDFDSLSDEMMSKYKELFEKAELFVCSENNGKITSIPYKAQRKTPEHNIPEKSHMEHADR